VLRVRFKRLDGLLADEQEKILAVLLSRHFAIQLSSQELKKENNLMPRGARYPHSLSE